MGTVRLYGKSFLDLINKISKYVLDVLCGQPIKLIRVASNSELRENKSNFGGNFFLEIESFWGHEVLKLYLKCSKNSMSWNIRTPKYPFFNEELKILVQNVHT